MDTLLDRLMKLESYDECTSPLEMRMAAAKDDALNRRIANENQRREMERRYNDGDPKICRQYTGVYSLVDTKQRGKKPNKSYSILRTTPQYNYVKIK